MRCRSLFFAITLFLGSAPLAFSKPFVFFSEERSGDDVLIYANLQNASCVSIDMNVTLKNMRSSVPSPIRVDLTQEKTLLTTLTKVHPNQQISYKYHSKFVVGRSNAKPDLAHVYKLPFAAEAKFPLRFGYGGTPNTTGGPATAYMLIWEVPVGTPVHAAREGVVVGVRDDTDEHGMTDEFRNKANVVIVEHDDGTLAEYTHLKYQGSAVALGQKVKAGELIGYSGNTGYSNNPKLLVRISRVNPPGARESLAAIWATTENYRTQPRGVEEGKGVDRLSSEGSADSAK